MTRHVLGFLLLVAACAQQVQQRIPQQQVQQTPVQQPLAGAQPVPQQQIYQPGFQTQGGLQTQQGVPQQGLQTQQRVQRQQVPQQQFGGFGQQRQGQQSQFGQQQKEGEEQFAYAQDEINIPFPTDLVYTLTDQFFSAMRDNNIPAQISFFDLDNSTIKYDTILPYGGVFVGEDEISEFMLKKLLTHQINSVDYKIIGADTARGDAVVRKVWSSKLVRSGQELPNIESICHLDWNIVTAKIKVLHCWEVSKQELYEAALPRAEKLAYNFKEEMLKSGILSQDSQVWQLVGQNAELNLDLFPSNLFRETYVGPQEWFEFFAEDKLVKYNKWCGVPEQINSPPAFQNLEPTLSQGTGQQTSRSRQQQNIGVQQQGVQPQLEQQQPVAGFQQTQAPTTQLNQQTRTRRGRQLLQLQNRGQTRRGQVVSPLGQQEALPQQSQVQQGQLQQQPQLRQQIPQQSQVPQQQLRSQQGLSLGMQDNLLAQKSETSCRKIVDAIMQLQMIKIKKHLMYADDNVVMFILDSKDFDNSMFFEIGFDQSGLISYANISITKPLAPWDLYHLPDISEQDLEKAEQTMMQSQGQQGQVRGQQPSQLRGQQQQGQFVQRQQGIAGQQQIPIQQQQVPVQQQGQLRRPGVVSTSVVDEEGVPLQTQQQVPVQQQPIAVQPLPQQTIPQQQINQ